jgi:urate oxidase
VEQFASGWKRSYYGKGDVIVYRLNRDGKSPAGGSPVFGANILMLLYGDAFWPTYTTGDNTGLIATDSMKNFIQRETLNYSGPDLEGCCQFLASKFLAKYSQVEGMQVSAVEIPYAGLPGAHVAFHTVGSRTCHRSNRDRPQRNCGAGIRHQGFQAASPRRQRIPRIRSR